MIPTNPSCDNRGNEMGSSFDCRHHCSVHPILLHVIFAFGSITGSVQSIYAQHQNSFWFPLTICFLTEHICDTAHSVIINLLNSLTISMWFWISLLVAPFSGRSGRVLSSAGDPFPNCVTRGAARLRGVSTDYLKILQSRRRCWLWREHWSVCCGSRLCVLTSLWRIMHILQSQMCRHVAL